MHPKCSWIRVNIHSMKSTHNRKTHTCTLLHKCIYVETNPSISLERSFEWHWLWMLQVGTILFFIFWSSRSQNFGWTPQRISQQNSLQKTPKSEYIPMEFDGSLPAYSFVLQFYMLSLSLHSQNSPFDVSLQPSSTNLLGLLNDLVKFCKNTKRTVWSRCVLSFCHKQNTSSSGAFWAVNMLVFTVIYISMSR